MAAWDATTGRTCKLVMKETSSSAKTFVGSAMASVSVLAARLTGSTSYFLAISQSPVYRLHLPDLPHLTLLRYSPQSLQCIRKGSVRIVLVEDEGDPFQAGVTGL